MSSRQSKRKQGLDPEHGLLSSSPQSGNKKAKGDSSKKGKAASVAASGSKHSFSTPFGLAHFASAKAPGLQLTDVRGIPKIENTRTLLFYDQAAPRLSKMMGSLFEFATGEKRAFRDAAEEGDLEKVKQLWQGGQDVDSASDYGATALHKACARGQLPVVRFLLSHGANMAAVHKGGKTALQEAEVNGHTEVVAVLRSAMSQTVAQRSRDSAEEEDEVPGLVEGMKEFVIQPGAEAVSKAAGDATEVVGDFVTGKKYSLLEVVTGQKRAFRDAAEEGDLDMVKQLLQAGQDVNSASDYGATALHKASARGQLPVVRFLLSQGANITTVHKGGKTALQEAEVNGHTEVVAALRRVELVLAGVGASASNARQQMGERGERLRSLGEKTARMNTAASGFADAARRLRESQ
eukprot:g1719.t1